jgi:hypothetical protein
MIVALPLREEHCIPVKTRIIPANNNKIFFIEVLFCKLRDINSMSL